MTYNVRPGFNYGYPQQLPSPQGEGLGQALATGMLGNLGMAYQGPMTRPGMGPMVPLSQDPMSRPGMGPMTPLPQGPMTRPGMGPMTPMPQGPMREPGLGMPPQSPGGLHPGVAMLLRQYGVGQPK